MTPVLLSGPRLDLSAEVRVPTSKSLTNRAVVASGMANGGTVVAPLDSEDTRLLAKALEIAGWDVRWSDRIEIGPRRSVRGTASLNIGNSGTGARLLLGLLAATPGRFVLDGTPRLRERPMAPLFEALDRLGARVEHAAGFLPATIRGARLAGGTITIRPDVSSQFVSSLLLAAPLMRDGLDLQVEGELPSRPYVDLTSDVLSIFGVPVEHRRGSQRWRVPGGTAHRATYRVEGDWSAAAFFAAAVAVAGGRVEIRPLSRESRQGDRILCEILQRAGVLVEDIPGGVAFSGRADRPFTADLEAAPDLFPALVVVAASLGSGTRMAGLENLRHKESDRLAVMTSNLERMGCRFGLSRGELHVEQGLHPLDGRPVKVVAADDHRIAMAMAVAALAAGPLELDDPQCVAKSFPGFWDTWDTLLSENRG